MMSTAGENLYIGGAVVFILAVMAFIFLLRANLSGRFTNNTRLWFIISITGLVVAWVAFFFLLVPPLFDIIVNRTRMKKPYEISSEALALHKTLNVVDLHSDPLISHRDLLSRSDYGHVDLPRLVEGNVALQVFTIPTKAPVREGITWLPTDIDALTIQVVAQRWPMRAWTSTFERALFCTQRLEVVERNSHGKFHIIRSVPDLEEYLVKRKEDVTLTAGILGVEGLHCLEGKLENLEALFDAGVRLGGLVHLGGNEVGGAAHGRDSGGLTPFGKEVVQRMEEKRMLVDLAHASPKLIDDVLDMVAYPVAVSHTGFTGVCDNERNLTDAQVRRVAENGGVLGVGYFPWATGGKDVASIIRTMIYGIELVGADHIALGSDYDGVVTTPFDTSGVALITDALMQEGLSSEDIAKIMGGNALRLFRETLPQA